MNVFIIAEAGVNHNGSIDLAKKLIDVASASGADAVKFQTFKADSLVTKKAPKAIYQKENTDKEETQFDMLKKLELDIDAHKELISYCINKKIYAFLFRYSAYHSHCKIKITRFFLKNFFFNIKICNIIKL